MYRVHNLILYLAALVLLLGLLVRFGFDVTPAAVGVLFFALAPYHVESVAWISGRKDALALLLALGAWHLHLGRAVHADAPLVRRLARGAAATGLLLLALLAKSAALVVPAMMLVADVGLLGQRPGRALARVAPYLLLSAALVVAVLALWSSSDLIREPPLTGPGGRVLLIGWTVAHYLQTALWPFALSPLYADPTPDGLLLGGLLGYGALVLVAGILVLAARRGRAVRGPAVAALWFFGALVPFSNAVPMYFLVADRYLLFPSLGIALLVALLAAAVLALERTDRRVLAGAGLLLVAAAWGVVRVDECRAWHSSEALWSHAVERQPDAFFARLKLAETLRKGGEPDRAATEYREARRIEPGSRLALTGLFWAELLADEAAAELSEREIEQLVLRFASALDHGPRLAALGRYLEGRGLNRAAMIVAERLSPRALANPGSLH
jgi:hypothetical protein